MLYVSVSIGTIDCSILYVVSGEFPKSDKVLHIVFEESQEPHGRLKICSSQKL